MITTSENQSNNGILSENFLPGSKVKDLLLQEHSQSQNIPFAPETPMKPSQIPNRFPHPPPRRTILNRIPQQCYRYNPSCHPPQPAGPHHFLGFGCFPPVNGGYLCPPASQPFDHMAPVQSCPMTTPQPTPYNNVQDWNSSVRPGMSSPSPFSHITRGPPARSTDTLSSPENKPPTGQDSNKSSHAGSLPMIQLHKPSQIPLSRSSAKEGIPLHRSDSWSPSSSQSLPGTPYSDSGRRSSFPFMHSPTSSQNQHHERISSNEKSHTENRSHILQKRRRESSSEDDYVKKPCLQAVGSDRTLKCTSGNVPSTTPGSQASQKHLSDLEPSPTTTERHPHTEPTPGNSVNPAQSSSTSLVPKPCMRQNSLGTKQACIKATHNNVVILTPLPDRSDNLTKENEESKKRDNPSTLLPLSHKSTGTGAAVKCPGKVNHTGESKKVDFNGPSQKTSCRKVHRPRKPLIPDDINDLFTPDPLTYVVNSGHKVLKVRTEDKAKTHISEKSGSSCISANPRTPVTRRSCHKEKSSTSTTSHTAPGHTTNIPQTNNIQISMPTLILRRVKIDDSSEATGTKNVTASSDKHVKDEVKRTHEKHKPHSPKHATPCSGEKHTAVSRRTSTSPSQPAKQSRKEEREAKLNHEDSLELDLELNFDLDLNETESSHSSEDEQLVSLQEIMARNPKPPDTPEKGAYSEPSTPGTTNHKRHHHVVSTAKTDSYRNNLDQMLKEIKTSKKAKEMETQLLTACQEDLLRIAEYEEAEENREEPISAEQQQFLQRYSLMSSAIREVPPGQVVFNLENFGRIFNQNTLQLRQCMVTPLETAQKTLLWSSHAQLRLHINIRLFQEAYNSRSPCPPQVAQFLFKMMSVHSEKILSEKILQALSDIAYSAASQIVKNGNQKFKVWLPTLADLTVVLMNMGVPFVSLYPLDGLQPSFTEGDLLEDVYIKSENTSSQKEPSSFPEHNCNNIFKYLSYCMGLCPRAYTDNELLLLLTVLSTISLDSQLILQSSVELYPLLYKIINNIRDWDKIMPKVCLALTDLTEDHHNMCHLVQLLPDHSRGKQLRRHLSLSMISKLLDGSCLYRPINQELQLSDLRLYLCRMKPSSLLRSIKTSSQSSSGEEDMASLDQQAYYLCYSLLSLANEVTNFPFFPAHQKEQLLFLCSELERHVKCHIRESEKCLYRSKVKDLVARIYTKWQMLLQRTRPLNGKLYDYWQPLQADTLSSQDVEEIGSNYDEDDTEKDSVTEEYEDKVDIGCNEETEAGIEAEEDENEAEEELSEEDVTQNGPLDELESTVEEINAAKEPVFEDLNKEMNEEAVSNKKNEKTQDEEMEFEDEELDKAVPNTTEDTEKEPVVEEDRAVSTLMETGLEWDAEEEQEKVMDGFLNTEHNSAEPVSQEKKQEPQGCNASEEMDKQTQGENMKFVTKDDERPREDIAIPNFVEIT